MVVFLYARSPKINRRPALPRVLQCALFLAPLTFWCSNANAQVPGTVLPSVYGDVPQTPLPFSVRVPAGTTFLKKKVLQLEQELEQSRRPYIGHIFSYANEPLDNRNNRVDTLTNGLEAGFYPTRQTQVQFNYMPIIFGLPRPTICGHQYIATVRSQPTDRLRFVTSAGLVHTFNHTKAGVAVIGGAGASYAVNDRVRLQADYRRDIVGDSRLSAVGLELPGSEVLVGRIKRNKFSVGISVRPTTKTNVSFRYSGGFDAGHRVKTNPFQEFDFRVARQLVSRERTSHLQFLEPSYEFLFTGFKYDLSNFGNATLIPPDNAGLAAAMARSSANGQTAIPIAAGTKQAGVGGYFSPQRFFLNSMRVDAGGRLFGSLFYRVGGSLGTQDIKNTFTNPGHIGIVGTANVVLSARFGKHVTVEQGWLFLQAADSYQRNVLYTQSRYYF